MKRLISIVAFAIFPALAADVAGDWKVVGDIGTVHVNRVCTLKQDGDKISGACKNSQGEVQLTGTVSGNAVTWQYTTTLQGRSIPMVYKATVESAEKMTGKMEIVGENLIPPGEFTATRQH